MKTPCTSVPNNTQIEPNYSLNESTVTIVRAYSDILQPTSSLARKPSAATLNVSNLEIIRLILTLRTLAAVAMQFFMRILNCITFCKLCALCGSQSGRFV